MGECVKTGAPNAKSAVSANGGASAKSGTSGETTSKSKAVRAVQVAMDLEASVARALKVQAALADMTPQDHMRALLGLDYKPARRPRLSISLSDQDYDILARRYGLDPSDHTAIKRAVIQTLTKNTPGHS